MKIKIKHYMECDTNFYDLDTAHPFVAMSVVEQLKIENKFYRYMSLNNDDLEWAEFIEASIASLDK